MDATLAIVLDVGLDIHTDTICCANTGTGSCNADDSACTVDDQCTGGICTPGPLTACPADANPCTLDACNPSTGSCAHSTEGMDGKFCDIDGDLCTFETCSGGDCYVNDFVDCPGGDPCKDPYCHPTDGCKYYASSAPCTDGNECTNADTCWNGTCMAMGGAGTIQLGGTAAALAVPAVTAAGDGTPVQSLL